MKRVVLISTSWPDEGEGAAAAGSFVVDFSKALAAQGVQVVVVVPALHSRIETMSGIDVNYFSVPCLPLSLLSPINPFHWLNILKTLSSGRSEVLKVCERYPDSHILSLWALPSGYWAGVAARRFNSEYSIWALGSDIWSLGRYPVIRTILKNVLVKAKHRFADGEQLCRDVEKIASSDCVFLPSSRNLNVSSTSNIRQSPPYRLVFLGRWHLNKGVDLLMQALLTLSEDDWSKIESVKIQGGGPLESELMVAAGQLQSSGRAVSVGGYLDRDQAKEFISTADYLIIPSRIESIPVIFSDAMQVGCPVLVSPVGDMPELVSKYRCGLVAEAVSVVAYSAMLKQAVNSSAVDFSGGVFAAAEFFSPDSAAKRFIVEVSE